MTTYLIEVRSSHIPHSPALVRYRLTDLFQELLLHLRRRQLLSNSNHVFHRQESHGVLIISLETAVDRQTVVQYMRFRQLFYERLQTDAMLLAYVI